MKTVTAQIKKFFGMTMEEFKKEWEELSKDEKQWFRFMFTENMGKGE